MPSATTKTINGNSVSGIRALAEQLSLSVGTISNVFNKPEIVAEPTKQRVLDAAEYLGFVPDRHARNLRSKRTRLIGILVSSIENPFYVEMVQQAQDAAAQHGYETILAPTGHWDIEREKAAVRYLLSLRVEGVFMAMQAQPDTGHLKPLVQSGSKIVVRGSTLAQSFSDVSTIDVDAAGGSRQATEHLLALGHRKLAIMIHAPKTGQASGGAGVSPASPITRDLAISQPKLRGAIEAITQAGLDKGNLQIINFYQESIESVYEAAREKLISNDAPTAILASNDTTALAAISAANSLGLSVPQDLSVVGYDNTKASRFYTPALSTVSQTHLNIGRRAAEIVIDRIESRDSQPSAIQLKPELIVRQSTAEPRIQLRRAGFNLPSALNSAPHTASAPFAAAIKKPGQDLAYK